MQCRQLRKDHPDSKYVAVIMRYAKEFAVEHSDSVLMISVDDKAIIPVGEPQCPVSTGVRGHNRSFVMSSTSMSQLKALDHDFHVAGIVPSVAFFPTVPSHARDSFFSGSVFVTLKDKVLQPSHAFRHTAELTKIIKTNLTTQPRSPRVILITSDGGSDHRLTYLSVQVAMISLFQNLDLDMLVAIRTCPYQSWTNMAERVMSTLNLALQNVSLARGEMESSMEARIKHKTSLSLLREALHQSFALASAYSDSMSPLIARLTGRFNQLKLKEDSFKCSCPASEEEIKECYTLLQFIEPSLCHDKLTKKDLPSYPGLQAFLEAHCHSIIMSSR